MAGIANHQCGKHGSGPSIDFKSATNAATALSSYPLSMQVRRSSTVVAGWKPSR